MLTPKEAAPKISKANYSADQEGLKEYHKDVSRVAREKKKQYVNYLERWCKERGVPLPQREKPKVFRVNYPGGQEGLKEYHKAGCRVAREKQKQYVTALEGLYKERGVPLPQREKVTTLDVSKDEGGHTECQRRYKNDKKYVGYLERLCKEKGLPLPQMEKVKIMCTSEYEGGSREYHRKYDQARYKNKKKYDQARYKNKKKYVTNLEGLCEANSLLPLQGAREEGEDTNRENDVDAMQCQVLLDENTNPPMVLVEDVATHVDSVPTLRISEDVTPNYWMQDIVPIDSLVEDVATHIDSVCIEKSVFYDDTTKLSYHCL